MNPTVFILKYWPDDQGPINRLKVDEIIIAMAL
jgi:hypothetical protein